MLPQAFDVDRSWIIVSGVPVNNWSDFAYLHEVEHLNNKDGESKNLRRLLGDWLLNAGVAYYFLKNPAVKRGITTIPLYFVGRLGLGVMNNLVDYQAKSGADAFSIEAPKAQRNHRGLITAAVELINFSKLDKKDVPTF